MRLDELPLDILDMILNYVHSVSLLEVCRMWKHILFLHWKRQRCDYADSMLVHESSLVVLSKRLVTPWYINAPGINNCFNTTLMYGFNDFFIDGGVSQCMTITRKGNLCARTVRGPPYLCPMHQKRVPFLLHDSKQTNPFT